MSLPLFLLSAMCPERAPGGLSVDEPGLGLAPPPLHRDRRRRDERPGAGLPRAGRDGDRQRPRRLLLYGATARRRPRACRRPRRRQPARGRRGRRLDRDRRGQPRAERWRGSAASSRSTAAAARRAVRGEAADRRRRHARQDDDDGDAGLGAAGARRRSGLLRRRRGARAGARGSCRQRRLGRGGVGRRRGRRERRQLPRAEARGRRRHQRRDGPSLALGLAGRAAPRRSVGSSSLPGGWRCRPPRTSSPRWRRSTRALSASAASRPVRATSRLRSPALTTS